MHDSVSEQIAENDKIAEQIISLTIQSSNVDHLQESDEKSKPAEPSNNSMEPHDLSMGESRCIVFNNNQHKEQYTNLNIENDPSNGNFSLSNRQDHPEEEENTIASYTKTHSPEPTESKIIVAHEDTDDSVSIVSVERDHEMSENITSESVPIYRYKYSQSAPASPSDRGTSLQRSLSRFSLRSFLDRSMENISSLLAGTDMMKDYTRDNYDDEDMEVETISVIHNECNSFDAKRETIESPISYNDDDDEEDDESDSEDDGADDFDDDEDDDAEDDDEELLEDIKTNVKSERQEDCKTIAVTNVDEKQDLHTQDISSKHYSTTSQFSIDHHPRQPMNDYHSPSNSENALNATNQTNIDSKNCLNVNGQKLPSELLNINEDAHVGPLNIFEFDGLQILVPSTFISESSQKAISSTSQQSMASSENGTGLDEEVKSVNMRADETMPARGELSEQESNGCTEQSTWQVRNLQV